MPKYFKILVISIVILFCSLDSSDEIHSGVLQESLVPEKVRLNNLMVQEEQFAGFNKVVNSFMRTWNLNGTAVAVAKEGKLVYAKGFGFADKENMIPAEPYHKFRIASVSKLVTAIAIMDLQEKGSHVC